MVVAPFILAASSIFALSQAAPLTPHRSLVARDGPAYKVFGGDGTTGQGWPAVSDWVEYDAMWEASSKLMGSSCWAGQPQNSDAETAAVKKGIEQAAKDSGLDHRFILAVIMQESGGCVRTNTTYSPAPDFVRNPGLMQDHDGKHTCWDDKKGVPMKTPCPDDEVVGMITDGVGTTNDGGLKQAIEQSKANDDSKYYKAARIYNSGSIEASGNLGKGVATHCYSSDIANRLTGWMGANRLCKEDTIGDVQGSASNDKTPTSAAATPVASAVSGSILPTIVPTDAPFTNGTNTAIPSGTAIVPSGTAVVPVPVSTGAAPIPTGSTGTGQNGEVTSEPKGPKGAGASANCKSWYTVKSGDDCGKIESFYGLPAGTVKKLNTGLNDQCTNLELGASYCVRDQ